MGGSAVPYFQIRIAFDFYLLWSIHHAGVETTESLARICQMLSGNFVIIRLLLLPARQPLSPALKSNKILFRNADVESHTSGKFIKL